MKYTHNDVSINYEIVGEGIPMLMIHGLGCDMELMKGCMEPLLKDEQAIKRIYIDLPGMGSSIAPETFASSDNMTSILCSFIKEVINAPFLLAGESYGGYLARGIAAEFLNDVIGMLLICPVIEPIHKKRCIPEKSVIQFDEKFLNILNNEERENFCEYAVIANQETYVRYCDEILVGVNKADNTFIQKLLNNYQFSVDVDKRLIEMKKHIPILIFTGKQDTSVGYKDQFDFSEKFANVTYLAIDKAGHNLQIEHPVIFNATTMEWLKIFL